PATFTSSPALAIRGAGQVDLFARADDNALWENYAFTFDNWATWSWRGWTPLEGDLAGRPSASAWGIGKNDSLVVAARGSDNTARVRVWTPDPTGHGTWTDWSAVGNKILAGEPTVTFSYPYFFTLARAEDGGLYVSRDAVVDGRFDPDGWSAWSGPVPGISASSDAAMAMGSGALFVAVRDVTNHYQWAKSIDNGTTWSAWSVILSTETFAGAPALSISPSGKLDVFGTPMGSEQMWNATSIDGGATWTAFRSAGGTLLDAPVAASPANGLIQTFGLGADNTVYWDRYQE
ncbi:MAG TPA: hypothetical protein VGL13_10400, partial [Polyangiaceae bacterium]